VFSGSTSGKYAAMRSGYTFWDRFSLISERIYPIRKAVVFFALSFWEVCTHRAALALVLWATQRVGVVRNLERIAGVLQVLYLPSL
jgi:hypothetical protein